MAAELVWTPQARADLIDIYLVIGMEQPRAAERYLARMEQKAKLLVDQPRLGNETALALKDKAVAERVEVKHPGDQHDHRHEVEGDDLAGERRAVQRDEAAPFAPGLEFGIDNPIGRRPVLTQDDVGTTVSRLSTQVYS